MKKYCFTECFKKKMSTGAKTALQVLIAIALVIVVLAVISGIAYVVGFGVDYFFPNSLQEGANLVEVGFVTILMFVALGLMLYLIVKGIICAAKGISNWAVARYEGDPYECKIFEECKEEHINVNIS